VARALLVEEGTALPGLLCSERSKFPHVLCGSAAQRKRKQNNTGRVMSCAAHVLPMPLSVGRGVSVMSHREWPKLFTGIMQYLRPNSEARAMQFLGVTAAVLIAGFWKFGLWTTMKAHPFAAVVIAVMWYLVARRIATGRPFDPRADMRGTIAIVTGSNTGIGLETARELAINGATGTDAHSLSHFFFCSATVRVRSSRSDPSLCVVLRLFPPFCSDHGRARRRERPQCRRSAEERV
jgi:hypothetical protein